MNWNDDIVVKSFGGILNQKALTKIDKSNIEELHKLFLAIRTCLLSDQFLDREDDIELVVLNDPGFLAFVRPNRNKYAICISIGLTRAIWNLLLLTLCDKNTFQGYPGDDEIEYTIKESISKELLFAQTIIPSRKFPDADLGHQNITAQRLELCQNFYCSILDYILYHECMHIIRDHFTYFSFFGNDKKLDETVLKKRNIKLYQLLEADADLVALSYSLESHPEMQSLNILTHPEQTDFFFGFLFSYVIIQQLFDFVHYEKPKEISRYPEPVYRAVLCSNLLKEYFDDLFVIHSEDLDDQENKAWYEASLIAKKLGFPKGHWHGDEIADVSDDKVAEFVELYNDFGEIVANCNQSEVYHEFKLFMELIEKK